MKTILSIIGARPQFIKHAAMQGELRKHFRALTLHTGQHYDVNMSGIFFEELEMPAPDYLLDIGGANTQASQTAIMMMEVEQVCQSVKPDAILIYGDTNTTLAGALVAAKMSIPYMHIEAGIRSYNREMPEEVNRIIADTFAVQLFCPTQNAVHNLEKEGIAHTGVFMPGDVMCDILERNRSRVRRIREGQYYYATIHRPYNADEPERMKRIIETFQTLRHPVVFPLHPRTVRRLKEWGISVSQYSNIDFIEPVGYLESISYQAFAECMITDSSGIQKEAYMLHRKCITLRSETEWLETLSNGWNTLVFDDIESIEQIITEPTGTYLGPLFGAGNASAAIAAAMRQYLEPDVSANAQRPLMPG